MTLAQAARLRPLGRAPDVRRHARSTSAPRSACSHEHRDPGRQCVERGRLRRPPDGHGGHPARVEGVELHPDGAEGATGPLPDALAHGGPGGRPVLPEQQRVEDLQPLRDRARHRATPWSRATSATTTSATAYFLEDGAETGNMIDRQPRAGHPGDRHRARASCPPTPDAATFWITNPDNTYPGQRRGRLQRVRLLVRAAGLAHRPVDRRAATSRAPPRSGSSATTWPTRTVERRPQRGSRPDGSTATVETAHYAPAPIRATARAAS